jgi:penicillin-binding protein 2
MPHLQHLLNKHFKKSRLLLLILAVATACGLEVGPNLAGGPTPAPGAGDAEGVAREFLEAWRNSQYDVMYGLISPRSQITSREVFTQAYTQAEETMKLSDSEPKRYTLLVEKTERQGNTVIIRYDMVFNSEVLGEFTDAERIMRLIITPRGWRLAWSTMDIFEGMAGGARLILNRTFAQRGAIYDRNNQLIAQDNTTNYAVRLLTRAYPGGQEECFRRLAVAFRLNKADLDKAYGGFNGQDRGFTIANIADVDINSARNFLDTACLLEYRKQTSRFYFAGNLASQSIGFVGAIQADQASNYPDLPPGTLIGQYGVERTYQNQLGGQSGARLQILTSDNIIVRTIAERAPSPGEDMQVTIARDFQLKVEQAVSDAYNAANWAQFSTGAAVVVLNVKTGEVLAMASYPAVMPDAWRLDTSFDVGTIGQYVNQRATVNKALEETYFLGSVMKIASMITAAETGQFKLDEIIDCRGTYTTPEGLFLTDWIYLEPNRDPNYHGPINLKQGLTSSCDVYFWSIGVRLFDYDTDMLRKDANRFGLGVRTGIPDLYEAEGQVPDSDWTRRNLGRTMTVGDNLNIVIGQGSVGVTVMQVARMMMMVANDGIPYTPYLVQRIGFPNQPPSYEMAAQTPDRVAIPDEVYKGVHEALCEVTTNKKIGTAQWVFAGFDMTIIRVCGKTGTAQSGTLYPHGWFAAYAGAPGKTPDIAVAAVVLNSREGSETAAPIVRRVIEAYYGMNYHPWPEFWSLPYELLPQPGLGEGGGTR